jgi:hypothetical protein
MSGFRRPKPIQLVPFAEASPRTFTTLLCDGVTARNLPSFAELMALHAQLQAAQPEVRVLASLDDLGQAAYTSGHCIDAHGLDDVEGHDLSELDPELFEDGEHLGYLSTLAEFPIRRANLLRGVEGMALYQVAGLLDWNTPGDFNDVLTVNRDPEAALCIANERDVIFQFVPVASAAETIAALPNGYFNADLDPMQNYVLSRHLEASYGLGLFGIGSRFLGFRCANALDEDAAQALAADLAAFYAGTPPAAMDELTRLFAGRDWLLLRYTDN